MTHKKVYGPLANMEIHQKHLDTCSLYRLHGEKMLYQRLIDSSENDAPAVLDIFKLRLQATKLEILKRILAGENP